MRWRNVAVTPLALAHHRGHLDNPKGESANKIVGGDRLSAGERFEALWRAVHASDVRSSSLEVSTRSSNGLFWTEARQFASEEIARIKARMERGNFLIVQNFCGECFSMAECLRVAGIEVHPDGRAFRIREALDDLVRATGGGQTLQHAPIRSASLDDRVLDQHLGD